MAILTLFTVSGAPGATTTALALALSWPREVVLIDADPTAAAPILAGWLQANQPHDRSLVDLVLAQRHNQVAEVLQAATLTLPNSSVKLMPGIHSPGQAASVEGLWPDLLPVLDDLDAAGTDVIIDAGRLSARYAPTAAITGADLSLLVTRATLPALTAVHTWQPTFTGLVADPAGVGLAVVGLGRPFKEGDIKKYLGLPILAKIAFDPVNAETFTYGDDPRHPVDPARFNNSAVVRSVRAEAAALLQQLRSRRASVRAAVAGERGTR